MPATGSNIGNYMVRPRRSNLIRLALVPLLFGSSRRRASFRRPALGREVAEPEAAHRG
jgi:hypothetical protein